MLFIRDRRRGTRCRWRTVLPAGLRSTIALAALAMALSSAKAGASDAPARSPVVIRATDFVPSPDAAFTIGGKVDLAVYRAFRAKHPDIEPEAVPMGLKFEGAAGEAPLLMSIAGGTAPEVIQVNTRQSGSYVERRFLLPLDDYVKPDLTASEARARGEFDPNVMYREELEARVLPGLMDAVYRVGPDGKKHVYCLPFSNKVRALAYRKDLFRKAGLDPERDWPKTWDELWRVAQKLHRPDEGYYGMLVDSGLGASWTALTFFYSMGSQVGVNKAPLPSWDAVGEEDKRELDFRRAMYAAQIERLDQNVGRIVARLKQRGIFENTLILFLSDNGCSGELGLFGLSWGKYTSGNYREWRKKGGWSISQGQCWASYSNTPLRKFKKFVHEGGISTPFIAHWPAGIRDPGRIVKGPHFHLIDVMPTLCEVAGAKYPKDHAGRDVTPAQGVSMVPALLGKEMPARGRPLFWQHENHAAVREGNWKLVTSNDRDPGAWELYNLDGDRSETEDLARERPEVVRDLKGKWDAWAREVNATPFPETRPRAEGVPWPPRPWPD